MQDEIALETPVMSNAIDVNRMPELGRVLDRMLTIQRDRYCGGERDEITAILAYASHYLESRDRAARSAEQAMEDALRDIPWVDHVGLVDPPEPTPDYVQVKFRDGETMFGIRWNWDENWWWEPDGKQHDGNIVAYRFLPSSSPSSIDVHSTG